VASHGVHLDVQYQQVHAEGVDDGFRVVVTASAPFHMSAAIFAYRLLPLQPGADLPEAIFDHVCTSADLADYPLEPYPNALPAWFRLDTVDVTCRTRAEADEFWLLLSDRVRRLVQSLDRQDALVALGSFQVGTSSYSSVGSP
jgi:hypothetical protein